jgi:hypothetical protein
MVETAGRREASSDFGITSVAPGTLVLSAAYTGEVDCSTVSMPEIFRALSEATICLLVREGSSSNRAWGNTPVSSTLLSMYDGGDLGSRITSSILPSTPDAEPMTVNFRTISFQKGIRY